uniref:Uncharacterized protein n=1 Tax=Anguilla anguilla TaxID=7936 RepID=A0A0E9RQC8_ANGAN
MLFTHSFSMGYQSAQAAPVKV